MGENNFSPIAQPNIGLPKDSPQSGVSHRRIQNSVTSNPHSSMGNTTISTPIQNFSTNLSLTPNRELLIQSQSSVTNVNPVLTSSYHSTLRNNISEEINDYYNELLKKHKLINGIKFM
jgi:hypothetical protein